MCIGSGQHSVGILNADCLMKLWMVARAGVVCGNCWNSDKLSWMQGQYLGALMQSTIQAAFFFNSEWINFQLDRLLTFRSLGCTVVEMLTGHPPWHEFEGVAAIFKIATTYPPIYELPLNTSEIVKNFLSACFKRNPDERQTAEELLNHRLVSFNDFT